MSDSQQTEPRTNFDDFSSLTPEMVRAEWRKALRTAPKIDYEEMRERLRDPKFKVKLSKEPLSASGYVRVTAELSTLRTEIVEMKMLIEERYSTVSKAVKNMEKIFAALASKSMSGTVKDKEGAAEAWLTHIKIQEDALSKLRSMALDILENIDMLSMQLNRQLKSVEMGVRSHAMDITQLHDRYEEEE